ncbi:MAG: 50S ribosomal protein L25 [Anaerolineales bacterium]|nr:50S ribosomal protein L25 [Anaerolineales bacterium]
MAVHQIKAEARAVIGKQVKALRRAGLVPAVIYGAGLEPIAIELKSREAERALARATGATLFDLELGGETHKVLVREVQRHSIRRDLRHVDFLKVAMDKLIRAVVPIELSGEAPAVKTLGGVLVSGVQSIEVEALPADLPDRVTISIDVLAKIDDKVTVADLALGKGVRVLTSADDVVARVIYQAIEVIEEPVKEAVAVAAEPEVIVRKKEDEEEDEEAK